MYVSHCTKNASTDADAPPASDMDLPYFAGREQRTAKIYLFKIANQGMFIDEIDLTAERLSRLTLACRPSGIAADGRFFVGLPGLRVCIPHASLEYGQLRLQGAFGATENGAFDKLIELVKTVSF